MNTMKPSAKICSPLWTTCESPRRHRQYFVDTDLVSAYTYTSPKRDIKLDDVMGGVVVRIALER